MRRQGQLLIREVKFDALTPSATYLSSFAAARTALISGAVNPSKNVD